VKVGPEMVKIERESLIGKMPVEVLPLGELTIVVETGQ